MPSGSIIPTEIITEILHRLPAKSLGRFRCVSKGFQCLVSEPGFIKTHHKTLKRKQFILDYDNKYIYTLPFNYHEEAVPTPNELCFTLKPHVDMFTVHGSCNGLVLVSGHDVDGGHRLIVLNPTTKVFFEVPGSGYDVVDQMRDIDIVFGFGYDSVLDDYKVVTVSFYNNDEVVNDVENILVHVYSLKTGAWRRVCRFRYDHSYGRSYSGVFVNGFLHWIGIKDPDEDLRVIVAFSLADERVSEVALPKACSGADVDVGVKNELRLVVGEKLAVFMEGEVWLMMEYGVVESWTKVVLRGVDVGLMARPEVYYENGMVLVVAGDLMLVYDIEEGRLCDRLSTNKFGVRGICVESLVSPNFNN